MGLLPQPLRPKYKTALVQIYVSNQPFGGSDKSASGHRYDTIPFANGMINAGMSCQLIHYVHEELQSAPITTPDGDGDGSVDDGRRPWDLGVFECVGCFGCLDFV